jgi:hypothetical protein
MGPSDIFGVSEQIQWFTSLTAGDPLIVIEGSLFYTSYFFPFPEPVKFGKNLRIFYTFVVPSNGEIEYTSPITELCFSE